MGLLPRHLEQGHKKDRTTNMGESMRASAMLKRCQEWSVNQCTLALNHVEPHNFTSDRKPHNRDAGYVASLRSGKNRGWVVIYDAAKQGIDVGSMRYAVVCQRHSAIVGATSVTKARASMKTADFCESCQRVKP